MDQPRIVRYVDDLPSCCRPKQLRLPRPLFTAFDASGSLFGAHGLWETGLDEWTVTVSANWSFEEDVLFQAVSEHVADFAGDFDEALRVLGDHGIHIDVDDMSAVVGSQKLIVARLGSRIASHAGRCEIFDGTDLWDAADAEAGDLEALVSPLISREEDELWCEEIMDAFPTAEFTDAVILLRAVFITPAARGHGLGAWAAAQSIALFDTGESLVATTAAPLSKRDGVPGWDEERDFTANENALWNAERDRLQRHWQTHLGLQPLSTDPNTLVWHTGIRNSAVEHALAKWRL